MHITIFHPAKLPVSTYGGTERVVLWLADGLQRIGHRVTLICGAGSVTPGINTVSVDVVAGNRHDFNLTPFIPTTSSIIHYFVPVHVPPPYPHLWTMQGNARPGFNPGPNCVFVSADHARRHGSSIYVFNGIDLDEYTYSEEKGDGALFLGRLNSVKGWKQAIRAARASNIDLTLAGGWRPTLRSDLKFVGKVGGKVKYDLLARARYFLMPIQWEEPFGIVVAEALASGTPVIATPRGSMNELISPQVGALTKDTVEMAELLSSRPRWDPAACRSRAEKLFSHVGMATSYVELYESIIMHGRLPAQTST